MAKEPTPPPSRRANLEERGVSPKPERAVKPKPPPPLRREKMTRICIEWEGPVSVKNAIRHNHDDMGLYQLYGRHPVFGRDSLLYIGKTTDAIANRIREHMRRSGMEGFSPKRKWIRDAVGFFSEVYYGRLIGSELVSRGELEQQINDAESLLIYACSPPWNRRGIGGFNPAHQGFACLKFRQLWIIASRSQCKILARGARRRYSTTLPTASKRR